jgi:hypothetical protein
MGEDMTRSIKHRLPPRTPTTADLLNLQLERAADYTKQLSDHHKRYHWVTYIREIERSPLWLVRLQLRIQLFYQAKLLKLGDPRSAMPVESLIEMGFGNMTPKEILNSPALVEALKPEQLQEIRKAAGIKEAA